MRHIYQGTFQDGSGRIVPSASVTVYLAGLTTLASIYSAESGGLAVTGSVVTTDSAGKFSFWVDDTEYTPQQKFKLTLSKTGYVTKSWDNIIIIPEEGYRYWVDPTAIDQGVVTTRGNRSVADFLALIGTSKRATLIFPHTGSADTTTYTFATSLSLATYPNVNLELDNGILLSPAITKTFTLYSPLNVKAQRNQKIFAGAGTIAWTVHGNVYPEWWGAVGDGVTNDSTAFTAAQASSDYITVSGKSYLASFTLVTGKSWYFENTTILGSIDCTNALDASMLGHLNILPQTGATFGMKWRKTRYCKFGNINIGYPLETVQTCDGIGLLATGAVNAGTYYNVVEKMVIRQMTGLGADLVTDDGESIFRVGTNHFSSLAIQNCAGGLRLRGASNNVFSEISIENCTGTILDIDTDSGGNALSNGNLLAAWYSENASLTTWIAYDSACFGNKFYLLNVTDFETDELNIPTTVFSAKGNIFTCREYTRFQNLYASNILGSGQFLDTYSINPPVGRPAIATAVLTGDAVTSITVNDSGRGYTGAPTVTFRGGGGSAAAATANMTSDRLTSFTVNNGGSGYTSAPVVVLVGGGVTYPRIRITGATLKTGPSGQTPAEEFGRQDTDMWGTENAVSLRAGSGAWDGGHLQLGSYHLWVDSTGDLRIKSSAPVNDTDGTVVGAQTA